ncbi:MAG: hypothetical protein PWQ86_1181 [Bacillota bacterium]|nr:hypothetical protein [Bacillota bacterium]
MARFTAVFQKRGNWWVGYVEELPGANTQGKTLEEARENLREAVALIIQANRDTIAPPSDSSETVREELVVNI